MRRRDLHKYRSCHRDRSDLAGVDDRHTQRVRRRQRRSDAGYLGRDNLGHAHVGKLAGQFPPDFEHQVRVDLVVDETVHLEDAPAHILTLGQDTTFECFHRGLAPPFRVCIILHDAPADDKWITASALSKTSARFRLALGQHLRFILNSL